MAPHEPSLLPASVVAHLAECPDCTHVLKWAQGYDEWVTSPGAPDDLPVGEIPLGLGWGLWQHAGTNRRGWRFDVIERVSAEGQTVDVLCYREWLPVRESLQLRDDLLRAFPLDRYPRLEDL